MNTERKAILIKLFFGIMATVAVLLFANMGQVILPFIFAGILAYFLQPFADMLLRHKIPLIFSLICVYLIFAALLYLFVFKALPLIVSQLTDIINDIPAIIDDPSKLPFNIPPPLYDYLLRQLAALSPDTIGNNIDFDLSILQSIGQLLFALLLAPLLSYYILQNRRSMKDKLIMLLPLSGRSEILRLAGDINRIFRAFFSGYSLLAIIVAILAFLLYSMLRLPYALLLALLLGISDLIPYFGPFVGAVPAVIIAYLQRPITALWVIAGVLFIQQLESSVLSPRILGSRIGLSPLTVIFSVLAGGTYFGILGMLFAVPAAASLKLLISYIYCRFTEAKV